jgi:hypothetical protein
MYRMSEDITMQYLLAKNEIRDLKKLNLILQEHVLLKKSAHIREVLRLEERIRTLEAKGGRDE